MILPDRLRGLVDAAFDWSHARPVPRDAADARLQLALWRYVEGRKGIDPVEAAAAIAALEQFISRQDAAPKPMEP